MAEGVVTSQPGQGGKGAELNAMPMPAMQSVVIPQGLPAGLAYLGPLNEVIIHQHFDALEVVVGCERNNKYRICNNQEQQFMYAKEDTDCLTRHCFGPARPFIMNITDNNWQPLIQLNRPFRCVGSLMWCCFLQEMDIMSPPGNVIGRVKQIWTPWVPKYQVNDAEGNHVFTIEGECCFCCICQDIFFKIYDTMNQEVGQIIRNWGGCREICGGVNDFRVQFPPDMDILKKTLLLSATYLIDFAYFERSMAK